MCGFAGYTGRVDEGVLRHMVALINHRGPDDSGMWFDKEAGIALAHTRLSIIDLSSAGHQPMTNEDESIQIVFNGEIYNFQELRKDLLTLGHKFKSNTDTEVLLHLYEEKGDAMFTDLNGIFAFALWDSKTKTLLLARDQMGVKPLYYADVNDSLVFASEMKAVLCHPSISKELNPIAICNHLSFLWSPHPHTMLKQVKKLSPGSVLKYRQGEDLIEWTYNTPNYQGEYLNINKQDAIAMLQEKLFAAVNRQMVSDVPVGSFLSGGLDSSSIVAFMKKIQFKKPVRCYGMGFSGTDAENEGFVNDLPYARKAASFLDVDLVEIIPQPNVIDDIGKMIYFLDEPQADLAALNVFTITAQARKDGYKVLMSGAGGDDIFSGYRRHKALFYEKYWTWLPQNIRVMLKQAVAGQNQNIPLLRRIGKTFSHADLNAEQRLMSYFFWIEDSQLIKLYSGDMKAALGDYSPFQPLEGALREIPKEQNPLNRMLYLEQQFFLADHNLNYTDKMSMANGVEVRVPFLDIELVNFAAKIPPHMKQNYLQEKLILKRAMEPFLPREIIYRPKTGFGVPLRKWIVNELSPIVDDLLSKQSIDSRGLFDAKAVNNLIKRNKSGEIDASYIVFSLMCIEWWLRIFYDRPMPVVPLYKT